MKTLIITLPSSDFDDPNIKNLKSLGYPQQLIDESLVNRTSIVGHTMSPDLKPDEEFVSTKVVGQVTYMYVRIKSLRQGLLYDLSELIRRTVINSYEVKS